MPDSHPLTADLIGHNGGPALDGMVMLDQGESIEEYGFSQMERW